MELGEIITYWVQYQREEWDAWTTCQPAYSSLEGAQAREQFIQDSNKSKYTTRIVEQITTNRVY